MRHDFMYRYLYSWGTCKLMYRYIPTMCVAWLLHVPVWLLCVGGRNMISCTSMCLWMHACGMTTGICPCMWHDCVYGYAPSMGHTCMHHAIICQYVPMHVAWQPIYVHVCDMIVFTGLRRPWGIHVCTMQSSMPSQAIARLTIQSEVTRDRA